MKSEACFRAVLDRIYFPGFRFALKHDGNFYLQIECSGKCNITGEPMEWQGRKWRLSIYMTDGEVVQTAFMATMAAMEHEIREQFTYRAVSVFDPHYDIEKLVELRRQPDALKERHAA
jgi:hypothetical protein